MDAIKFKESNQILHAPKGMTSEECGDLYCFSDGQQFVSCWRMNFKERFKAFFTGIVWLSVLSGEISSPPVKLGISKAEFLLNV